MTPPIAGMGGANHMQGMSDQEQAMVKAVRMPISNLLKHRLT
jgi:hypothetical protein